MNFAFERIINNLWPEEKLVVLKDVCIFWSLLFLTTSPIKRCGPCLLPPSIHPSFSDKLLIIKCSRNEIITTSKSWSEKPTKLLLDALEALALSKACHHVKSLITCKNTMLERPQVGTLIRDKADGPPTASINYQLCEWVRSDTHPTLIFTAFSPSWHLRVTEP